MKNYIIGFLYYRFVYIIRARILFYSYYYGINLLITEILISFVFYSGEEFNKF